MPVANGRVQAAEEQRCQDRLVEIVSALQRRFEPIDEKPPLAVEPSLVLDEVEEEQSRQDQERLRRRGIARLFRRLSSKQRVELVDCGAESLEELPRQRFAIERPIEKTRVIGIARSRQQIETIDRVRRRIVQVDVEPPQLAML